MKYVIGIIGRSGSGKDTCFNLLEFLHRDGKLSLMPLRCSFADALKYELADLFKTPDFNLDKEHPFVRKTLQDYGMWCKKEKGEDYWIQKVRTRLQEYFQIRDEQKKLLVFTDVRFINEADYIHKELGGKLIKLRREAADRKEVMHESEAVDKIRDYDIVINNEWSIPRLREMLLDTILQLYPELR